MTQSPLRETRDVLVVSSHAIFAKTLVRLAHEAGCQLIASVPDLRQALNILQPNAPARIIVEYEDVEPRQDEWLPFLQQANADRRVILLSLAKNEMIVHERRRVTHVNEAELKQALNGSSSQFSKTRLTKSATHKLKPKRG
ncbi:hypothetical protein ANRL3_02893 [Anaerolineae bacterium]|nr:hypothetical protein ANRL3_02893 [Anaerolineae bacterium]